MRNLLRHCGAVVTAVTLSLVAGDLFAAAPAPLQTVEIVAEGMCCQNCARKVSGKLYTARGVRSVATHVPTHTVTVQSPEQGEAYLGTLWDAVAAGGGAPTSLTTDDATFHVEPAEAQAKQSHSTTVHVSGLDSEARAQRLAEPFTGIEGVTGVRFDPTSQSLIVITGQGRRLSPWAAVEIAIRVGERPDRVTDSTELLSVEWRDAIETPAHNANLSPQGGVNR